MVFIGIILIIFAFAVLVSNVNNLSKSETTIIILLFIVGTSLTLVDVLANKDVESVTTYYSSRIPVGSNVSYETEEDILFKEKTTKYAYSNEIYKIDEITYSSKYKIMVTKDTYVVVSEK